MCYLKLILRLGSDYRFRIPKRQFEENDDLEIGSWYTVRIEEKVKNVSEDDSKPTEDSGIFEDLISEKSPN